MPSSTGTLVFNDQKIQAPDIYATESLGVGVSDPTSNLEVVGNAYVSSNLEVGTANLFVDTTTGRVGVGTTSPENSLHIFKSGNEQTSGLFIEKQNVGTGTAQITFGVNGSSENVGVAKAGIFFQRASINGRGDLKFCVDNANDANNVGVSDAAMTIYRDGNVGIGTTNPGAKLHVNGYILNNNPVFHAYRSLSTTTTTAGVYNDFSNTHVNRGGHYYTSGDNQGKFVAPVAGVYYFSANMLQRQRGSSNYSELTFYKNGTNISDRSFGYTRVVSSGDHDNLHIEMMIELAANDHIQVAIHAIASGTDFYTGENLSSFKGFLIG